MGIIHSASCAWVPTAWGEGSSHVGPVCCSAQELPWPFILWPTPVGEDVADQLLRQFTDCSSVSGYLVLLRCNLQDAPCQCVLAGAVMSLLMGRAMRGGNTMNLTVAMAKAASRNAGARVRARAGPPNQDACPCWVPVRVGTERMRHYQVKSRVLLTPPSQLLLAQKVAPDKQQGSCQLVRLLLVMVGQLLDEPQGAVGRVLRTANNKWFSLGPCSRTDTGLWSSLDK